MGDEFTLQIKATFAEVQPANEAASRWLAARRAPPRVQYVANLAIEELVTNCVKYGYDDAGEHVIEITLGIANNELALTVADDGHPFNPLAAPAPDICLPVEERPVGGLGLHLLRRLSDRMEYVRVGGKNRVTVYKSMGG